MLGELGDLGPLRVEAEHVALELFLGRALGRGPHDETGVARLQPVEDPPEALALVVGQALRDAVGLGLARHHDDETPGQAHLLREARALVPDRVLRDLHDDRLAVAQHPLDAGPLAALDLARVVGDVAAVQHAVLGRPDVDERGFHAGQHVLNAPEIDVAVDRRRLVGRRRDVVLDELAAFEDADVADAVGPAVHDHQVAPGGTALAARAPAPFQRLGVERLEQRGAVDVDVAELARVDVLDRGACRATAAAISAVRSCPPGARRRPCCGLGPRAAAGAWPARRCPRPSPRLPARSRRGAGRESPIFGRGGAGGTGDRPVSPLGLRPASSRACSAMSSSVKPRSAAASFQSSPPLKRLLLGRSRPGVRSGRSRRGVCSGRSRPGARRLLAPPAAARTAAAALLGWALAVTRGLGSAVRVSLVRDLVGFVLQREHDLRIAVRLVLETLQICHRFLLS